MRVQARFDGELDPVEAADVERHVEHCAECRALLQSLQETRTAIRRYASTERASAELRARIRHALDQEGQESQTFSARPGRDARPPWRWPFLGGVLSGALGGALAATLAFLLLSRPAIDPMLDDLVAAHVRSLMPSHLFDVASSEQHTVKPWFAGHSDVSPVVADFAGQGYRLVGGRADYFAHQRAAAVVYQHGAHIINVFSWAGDAGALPATATRHGYHIACWRAADLQYCAVSDTGWDELLGLVALLRERSAADLPK
jgi:anti-sigma factor RsiW